MQVVRGVTQVEQCGENEGRWNWDRFTLLCPMGLVGTTLYLKLPLSTSAYGKTALREDGLAGLGVDHRDRHRGALAGGRRIALPAIASPRPTEIVTRARARRPEARLASHQPWVCSVVEVVAFTRSPPPRPGAREGGCGAGR